MFNQTISRQEGQQEMLEIDSLTKENVYDVMRELLYSVSYAWHTTESFVRAKHPELLNSEAYLKVNEDFGSSEANRLSKALGISGGKIDSLIQLLKHSHWAVFENIEVKKLAENSFRMRTIGCSSQKTAKKWGMEYYDCRLQGLRARHGFFKAANKNAKVERIFSPPESRREGIPDNVSCEWLVSIK
jgi:hypothetical protein